MCVPCLAPCCPGHHTHRPPSRARSRHDPKKSIAAAYICDACFLDACASKKLAASKNWLQPATLSINNDNVGWLRQPQSLSLSQGTLLYVASPSVFTHYRVHYRDRIR